MLILIHFVEGKTMTFAAFLNGTVETTDVFPIRPLTQLFA